MKASVISHVVLFLAVFALSAMVISQSSRIDTLEEKLASVDSEDLDGASDRVSKSDTTASGETARARTRNSEKPSARNVAQLDEGAVKRLAETASEFADDDLPEEAIVEKVREAVADEVDMREQQRWQKRLDHQTERAKKRVSEFADRASLSEATKVQIEDLIVTEQAEVSEIFREARENFSFGDAREKVETARKETEETARAILDDDEYAEFEKMREEEVAAFRRFGRPPRGNNADKKPEPTN